MKRSIKQHIVTYPMIHKNIIIIGKSLCRPAHVVLGTIKYSYFSLKRSGIVKSVIERY